MNRRTSISTLLGRSKKKTIKPSTTTVSGLDEYTGPWEFKQAAHLLRRTMFGPNYTQIQSVVSDGMQATIAELLMPTIPLIIDPPVNYYYEDEPNTPVPVGETWVSTPQTSGHHIYRKKSLEGWTVKQILDEGISLKEKMTLFWHNHFVTADFPLNIRHKYDYISTIRENALGNFKELAKLMTVNPLMLHYLNGNSNSKAAPNENYARELLELFTIGKGPIIAPGDYTNYTESDIAEVARILTGWKATDTNNQGVYTLGSIFQPSQHDTEDKQLSSHFNNAVISDAGENEYINLINIIFEQDEVARFICRKIYRWFVHYNINDDIETNIIEPLAQVLIDNDYNISPVLQTLFSSQHFYEEERYGCMIKNPWDFVMSTIKQFQVEFPSDPAIHYETFRVIFQGALGLQMEYYNPPSVSGWKAYYQSPAYYRIWLNSVTLQGRNYATSVIATFGGIPLYVNPSTPTLSVASLDYLEVLNNLSNPFEINAVIDDFIKLLFAKDIADNQKNVLKNVVLSGLPDFEWNVEYSEYISDPTNETQANAVKDKIKNLVGVMFAMPEYQLM